MLATSKAGCSGDNQSVRSSASVVSRRLGPGNMTFLEVVSMVVTPWIVAFLRSAPLPYYLPFSRASK